MTMFKAILIVALLLLLFLFTKCSSPYNYPEKHLQFYDNRYYPIEQKSEMPKNNSTKLVLYGTHHTAKGDTTKQIKGEFTRKYPFIKGGQPLNGYFFVDVDAEKPTLTHWKWGETGSIYQTSRPYLAYGGHKIFLQENGTFGAMVKPTFENPKGGSSQYMAGSLDGEWHVYLWNPYGSEENQQYKLHLQNISEADSKLLLETPDYPSSIVFAPDNQHILFTATTNLMSKEEGVVKEKVIRWMNVKDSTYREIHRDTTFYSLHVFLNDTTAVLSRDHQMFTLDINSGSIHVLYEGQAFKKITHNEDGSKTYHTTPSFAELKLSPNAQKIAFKYNGFLWCMDVNGENPIQVVKPHWQGGFGGKKTYAWLPDSKRLVYKVSVEGEDFITHSKSLFIFRSTASNNRLYLIDIEEKKPREILSRHIDLSFVGGFNF